MIYYTSEFASAYGDVDSYVTTMISEANVGLANSGVNVVMHAPCRELADLEEVFGAGEMLDNFVAYKSRGSNISYIRNLWVNVMLVSNFMHSMMPENTHVP